MQAQSNCFLLHFRGDERDQYNKPRRVQDGGRPAVSDESESYLLLQDVENTILDVGLHIVQHFHEERHGKRSVVETISEAAEVVIAND